MWSVSAHPIYLSALPVLMFLNDQFPSLNVCLGHTHFLSSTSEGRGTCDFHWSEGNYVAQVCNMPYQEPLSLAGFNRARGHVVESQARNYKQPLANSYEEQRWMPADSQQETETLNPTKCRKWNAELGNRFFPVEHMDDKPALANTWVAALLRTFFPLNNSLQSLYL